MAGCVVRDGRGGVAGKEEDDREARTGRVKVKVAGHGRWVLAAGGAAAAGGSLKGRRTSGEQGKRRNTGKTEA